MTTETNHKNDRKTAMAAAAQAARHAAAMGWVPNTEGALISGDVYGTGWSCCALGAVALQHKLDSQTDEHTMPDILLEVEDMSMSETLEGVAGIEYQAGASRAVARVFDRMATSWHLARYGLRMDSLDRRVMEENGFTDAEDFAHLSRSEFWLLVAKRFEGLSR